MVAEYTYTNSAKSDPCQQFSPERRQARKAKSGRVVRKLCHQARPHQIPRLFLTVEPWMTQFLEYLASAPSHVP